MAFTCLSNIGGVDLNNSIPTAAMQTNSTGGILPPHKLGTIVEGSSASRWVFAVASGAITAGDTVTIDTAGTAQRATPANVATGAQVAFAQNTFATGEYGWFAINGNTLTLNVSSTTGVNLGLYIGSSGKLTFTTSSGTIMGISLTYASTIATIQAVPAVVSWPRNPVANA